VTSCEAKSLENAPSAEQAVTGRERASSCRAGGILYNEAIHLIPIDNFQWIDQNANL